MNTKLRDLDDELGAAFRSADRDGPRPEAKAALMAALGVGVVAAASTAAAGGGAAAAGAATTAAAGGSTAAAAKGVGLAVIAKWFIASAVIVGGTAATVHAVAPSTNATAPAVTERARPLSPPRTTAFTPTEPPTAQPANELPAEAPLPVITPEALRSVTAAPAPAPAPARVVVVAPSPSAASTTTESGPSAETAPRRATVADEITALDGARSLLARGNGAGALDALRDYHRAFPAGVLAQEASVLEIESLASAGQRDRARTLGDRFVAEHPQSPLVPRVVRAAGK